MADSIISLPIPEVVARIMTTTDRDAVPTPTLGRLIFNATSGALQLNQGTWVSVSATTPS